MLSNYPLNMHTLVLFPAEVPECLSAAAVDEETQQVETLRISELLGPKRDSCTSHHPILSQSSGSIQQKES